MLGGKPSTLTSQFAQPLGMYSISAITVQTDRVRPLPIDYHWYSALHPFIVPFVPPEAIQPGSDFPREPLGLVLTRPTAALLAGARPPTDETAWKSALEGRTAYIDVPHGPVDSCQSSTLTSASRGRAISTPGSSAPSVALCHRVDRHLDRHPGREARQRVGWRIEQ